MVIYHIYYFFVVRMQYGGIVKWCYYISATDTNDMRVGTDSDGWAPKIQENAKIYLKFDE